MTSHQISPDKLQAALLKLDASKLSARKKATLKKFTLAQMNPDAQAPDVVAKSMKRKRRKQVTAATEAVSVVFGDVGKRGKAALEAMSDSEWEGLSQ